MKYFFSRYGDKFYKFLADFEIFSIDKEYSFIFKEDLLKLLTSKTKTYDLLHFYLSMRVDGIITTDEKFVEWIKNNLGHFQRDLKENYNIIYYSIKSGKWKTLTTFFDEKKNRISI